MSLNGLDATAVVKSHQLMLADPGGWFLLKYVNRDTVELLTQGSGGVAEAKSAVGQYEEKSPLFGMLQYRRKRVLLKYVPTGTSRLLQVRLTVQFQSVLDTFPHDTVFSFTDAAELVESALGLSAILQPTTGESLKSSNSSLRQRRLNEISEDAEDSSIMRRMEQSSLHKQQMSTDTSMLDGSETSTLPASAIRAKALLAKRRKESLSEMNSSADILSNPASKSLPLLETNTPVIVEPPRPLSTFSQLKSRNGGEPSKAAFEQNTPSNLLTPIEQYHSRHLSENESHSISQWNEQVAAYTMPLTKPKKKLAPRLHVESQGRPKTANQDEELFPSRPVSNLPTSIRVSTRPNAHSMIRPGSQQSSRSVPARLMATRDLPPPLPDLGQFSSPYMRPESRQAGSVISSTAADGQGISPEKLRLMKALQNRRRTQILAQRAASAQPTSTREDDDFPLGRRESIQPASIHTVPATISEEIAKPPQEIKSAVDSSSTSPTSIGTTSEEPSTRPSSFAEEQESHASQKSESHDTDASSTPKALPDISRATPKRHTSWFDSAPELELTALKDIDTPQTMPLIDEDIHRETRTPTKHEIRVEQATPEHQDRSTFSWLATDSDLSVVAGLVQAAESVPENQVQNLDPLGLKSRVSRDMEGNSVMSDDDDDEEAHVATFHEAKPMTVSRPPLTPTMRTLSSDRSRATTLSSSNITPKSSQSTYNTLDKTPGRSSGNVSTALPQWPPGSDEEPMAVSLAKKTTLGHGISQRIKALEDSSRKEIGSPSASSAHEASVARSGLSNLMKRNSFVSQFQGSSSPPDTRVPKDARGKGASSVAPSDRSTTPRPRARVQNSSSDLFKSRSEIESSANEDTNTERQDSNAARVSVVPDLKEASFEALASASQDRKRFSFASYRSGSTTKSTGKWMQPDSMASRLSIATKDSRYSKAASEASSVHDEKRGSKTSRLMKRLSGFGKRQPSASTKKDARPAPIQERYEPDARGESMESTGQMIDIGNVNVQFPETLLWKRRFLKIDDQGYLIFTAPSDNTTMKSISRKFHLADVQEPCLPDLEREEIAWSVLLDLRDGNCIQCACESKQAQARVLKMLLDAHNAYHSLYPDALE